MNITQKQGIITLIPKAKKDPLKLKNWRPISLLNFDYKLLTKCLASRLRKVIPDIIYSDQTGFMSNRYIGENINKILNLMDKCQREKIEAYLMIIDFEKAFDFLNWKFIQKTLKYFNFGPNIARWIKICYKDISSCVVNNGWSTSFFHIERGVRQGCPLSPYIFILAAEILANRIRNNTNIKGIKVGDSNQVLSQYADDTSLFLTGGVKTVRYVLELFSKFEIISGLKVNIEKTEIMPMSDHRLNKSEIEKIGLHWSRGPVSILGVVLETSLNQIDNLNYIPKLEKIKETIRIWNKRKMTPMGKITIIKSEIISQLQYLFSSIPNPTNTFWNDIETVLYKFIWSNGPDKIKRLTLIAPKQFGGLDMVHVKTKAQASKIVWVSRLFQGELDKGWRKLVDYSLNQMSKYIFTCNLDKKDVKVLNSMSSFSINKFWIEVLESWCEYNFFHPEKCNDILNQSIWFNSHIRIDGKIIFYKKWFNVGIKYIGHITKYENGKRAFLTAQECSDKYVKIDVLRYNGIIHALSKNWKISIKNRDGEFSQKFKLDKTLSGKNLSKKIYSDLLQDIYIEPDTIFSRF